ncbi:bifunctional DNA primase/polymerase [Vulgatibacter sp.]|uniref:bifunctional DNA primase/polymerase n=1 Tax=Vulgatibacter sp. TaxID=1971226 RepID=UPI0035698AA0
MSLPPEKEKAPACVQHAEAQSTDCPPTQGNDRNRSAPGATREPSLLRTNLERYLGTGLPLIPLEVRGKLPVGRGWQRAETHPAPEEVIERALASGSNVGVLLPPTVVVVDVDPRNGGAVGLFDLDIETGLDLSKAPHVLTGGGGDHYYFRKPADLEILDSLKRFPGVEFKSIGRQVVAAGCIHPSGANYRWADGSPGLDAMPELPERLAELIRRPANGGYREGSEAGIWTPEQLAAALSRLPAEDYGNDPGEESRHEAWLKVPMGSHHATGGLGREEFLDWCCSDARYADRRDKNGYRWDSLHLDRPRGRPATYKAVMQEVLKYDPTFDFRDEPEDDFGEVESQGKRPEMPEAVARLNEDHFTVLHAGKYLAAREVRNELGHLVVEWFAPDALRRHYDFPQVEHNGKMKGPGELWLGHAKRRRYERVVFNPSTVTPAPPEHYNLWKGWAVEPRAGGDWSLMRRLLRDVLCAGDEASFRYVLRWSAFMVQRPEVPAEVAVVFRGGKGIGKGTFCRQLVEFAGQHGRQIANPEHLVGRFNAHLRDCICLFVDEGFWAGDKKVEGVLKNLVTERTLTFEQKGEPLVTGLNLLHIVMASNEEWVVPASEDERRFAVLDASAEAHAALPPGFFRDLDAQMLDGGKEAMLHELRTMDLGDWHPRQGVPQTRALAEQKLQSLSRDPLKAWWYGLLDRGTLPGHNALDDWRAGPVYVIPEGKDALLDDLNASHRRAAYSKRGVAQFLALVGARTDPTAKDRRGNRAWILPRLDEARSAFAEWARCEVEWDD